MKIGTDASFDVCQGEGYMMIEYAGRKPFNTDTEINCIAYWPVYDPLMGGLRLSSTFRAKDLFEIYEDNKKGIDSFIGGSHEMPDSYYDTLNLASDIDGYLGLDLY